LLAELVVCTGAGDVVGGLDGGATAAVVFGAVGGVVDRTGAGAVLCVPAFAGAVPPAVLPAGGAEPDGAAEPGAVLEAVSVPEAGCWVVEEVSAAPLGADRANRVTKATTARALN
jgi:hypothetical protein